MCIKPCELVREQSEMGLDSEKKSVKQREEKKVMAHNAAVFLSLSHTHTLDLLGAFERCINPSG